MVQSAAGGVGQSIGVEEASHATELLPELVTVTGIRIAVAAVHLERGE